MRLIGELIIEANYAAIGRGHNPAWKPPSYRSDGATTMKAICLKCFKEMQVNTKPAPNDIDIGGEMVARICKEGKCD